MGRVNYKKNEPPGFCTEEMLLQLKKLGVKTDGSIESLEAIILSYAERIQGLRLPRMNEEGGQVDYWFQYQGWTRICLSYVDTLAEGVIVLKNLGVIK